jgi:hypothetical protein
MKIWYHGLLENFYTTNGFWDSRIQNAAKPKGGWVLWGFFRLLNLSLLAALQIFVIFICKDL